MEIDKSVTKLSRNPLGIMAMFILLVYGVSALLFNFVGDGLSQNQKWWFVVFLTIFPVIVLFVFTFLVAKHHKKLYAPSDYRDERCAFGNTSPKEQQEKYEKEVREEEKELKESSKENKTNLEKRIKDIREKIESIKDDVFYYYERKFDYEIDKDIWFKTHNGKVYFDGISERNHTLNFFVIKYSSCNMFSIPILKSVVFDVINVKNFMVETRKCADYRYRLKLILVVDTDDASELKDLKEKIHAAIDIESINISIKVFSLNKLKKITEAL